ncbi:MAG: hypothetical protein GXO00_03205 [Candidatus Diapherotrites archaeon]|nr:hypothetical protein [Candidatus Diapherotrites archaeon]
MKVELVILAALTLFLLSLIASLPVPSTDRLILTSCSVLVDLSSIHGASVELPCSLEEGKLVYGEESVTISSTSYGVVVKGEHWPAP